MGGTTYRRCGLASLFAVAGLLGCSSGGLGDAASQAQDDPAARRAGAADRDDGAGSPQAGGMSDADGDAPQPCQGPEDCPQISGQFQVCSSARCGPSVCMRYAPSAAPGIPTWVCTCDGRPANFILVSGSPTSFAYSFLVPVRPCNGLSERCEYGIQEDGFVQGSCDPDGEPPQWSVRVVGTQLATYEGQSISVAVDGVIRDAPVEAGRFELVIDDWPQDGAHDLLTWIDTSGDGGCNDDEVAFLDERSADVSTGVVTVTLTGETHVCEAVPPPPPAHCPPRQRGILFDCLDDGCAPELSECDETCMAMFWCQRGSGCVGNGCSCACEDVIAGDGSVDVAGHSSPGTSPDPWRRLNDCMLMAGCYDHDHAGEVRITELDYRQPSGIGDFVEVCNPRSEPAELMGAHVQVLAADGQAEQELRWVSLQGTLQQNQCVVLHDSAVQPEAPALSILRDDGFLRDGPGTVRVLREIEGSYVIVDSVSYEIGTRFGEGEPTVADPAEGDVSLARWPWHEDTDDNLQDLRPNRPTPGGPNPNPGP